MRTITTAERRARLGRRHALAPTHQASDPVDAARRVVALHGTDPATTFLSAVQRSQDGQLADVEKALYEDRSLVRVLAMRRTVFAIPTDLVGACLAGASDTVAREQRRLLVKLLGESDVSDDPVAWLSEIESVAIAAISTAGEVSSAELAALDERLATRIVLGAGSRFEATQAVTSRLLTLLSAEGDIVRARPRGAGPRPSRRNRTSGRQAHRPARRRTPEGSRPWLDPVREAAAEVAQPKRDERSVNTSVNVPDGRMTAVTFASSGRK